MTMVFCEFIADFIHGYLDDIFVFSLTIEEHEVHLVQVFDKLHKAQLYLAKTKLTSTLVEWTVSAMLSQMLGFMPMPIRCRRYKTGVSLIATTRSNTSWVWCNI